MSVYYASHFAIFRAISKYCSIQIEALEVEYFNQYSTKLDDLKVDNDGGESLGTPSRKLRTQISSY